MTIYSYLGTCIDITQEIIVSHSPANDLSKKKSIFICWPVPYYIHHATFFNRKGDHARTHYELVY